MQDCGESYAHGATRAHGRSYEHRESCAHGDGGVGEPEVEADSHMVDGPVLGGCVAGDHMVDGLGMGAYASVVPAGSVVLAATPIGNTADASLRLMALLQGADIVAAEDTRRLYDLANRLRLRVRGRVVAYHDHNERGKADVLLDEVERGRTVLVVSDAGMPTINDPGLAIVRHAIERGLPVTCAPGPSAVLDALALSGLPTDRFCYEGFLPRRRGEREQRLRALRGELRTMVFYEAPHRIAEAMEDIDRVFGSDRPMALCRELTKDFEQVRRGTVGQVRDSVAQDPPRGEIVLVVAGASREEAAGLAPESWGVDALAALAVERSQRDGMRIKEAIAEVVREHPAADGSLPNRKAVYAAVLAAKESPSR